MIRLPNVYQGKLTNEQPIPPGDYAEDDERLFGLAAYLVENGHAFVISEDEVAVSEALAVNWEENPAVAEPEGATDDEVEIAEDLEADDDLQSESDNEADFMEYTVKDLKAIADENGIAYGANIRKDDLTALLQELSLI